MKILDLGCHDAYMGLWLAQKLRDRGHDQVRIDGIDANRLAVIAAQKRAIRNGVAGEFHVGLAENAPDLFEPGSYDAVIAFELIEHVAEVDRLLAVCEAMCKPGGRVYLSTPDGTFGAGQNPHHLRVYRAIDLFDLLRRRGTLENMAVGGDTITVASYTPAVTGEDALADRRFDPRAKEVAIWCGPGWEHWSPLDIERRGLGGSETAAVRLAESLSARGYVVTVYGECEPTAFSQVAFRHHSAFDPSRPRLAVIGSRSPQLFGGPLNAAVKVLWMHDTDYGPALTDQCSVDAVMVLSGWHRAHVDRLYPFLADRIHETTNAIQPSYFIPSSGEATGTSDGMEDPGRPSVLYSSSPDRGLDFLLELWPRVRERVPDALLRYCYADVYNRVADQRPDVGAFRERVRALADQEGVQNLGSLPQPVLAQAMLDSRVWVAPSWNGIHGVRFHETFCIGAVEAAAAGCHLVMSNWGALPERAETAESFVLLGDREGDQPPDADEWVEQIVAALTAPPVAASSHALELTWDRVADDFLAIVERAAPAPVCTG